MEQYVHVKIKSTFNGNFTNAYSDKNIVNTRVPQRFNGGTIFFLDIQYNIGLLTSKEFIVTSNYPSRH